MHIQKYDGFENIEKPGRAWEVTLGSSTDTNIGHNHTKNTGVFSKIKKSVFLPVFSFKPNSFRGPGGFCWPTGVTAALLGRLLPSDGHKLVKKPEI